MKKFLTTAIAAVAVAAVPAAVSAQEPIIITLVQGIPTPPNVDIIVDGATTAGSTNLAAGSVVNVTDYAGTNPTLEVVETGTSNTLMTPQAVSVPATGNNSVVLTATGVMLFANNTSQVDAGMARLTIRNTSADVASINLVGAAQPINNVSRGAEGTIVQAAGSLSSAQIVAGGGAAVAAVPSTNLAAGTNTILYLIGDATSGYSVTTQVIEVVQASPQTTTTTTTIAGQTTTTTSTTTTTTAPVPSAVNTGAPIDEDSPLLWVLVVAGGLAVAGGAYLVRRRL
jgi:hypothetical protein